MGVVGHGENGVWGLWGMGGAGWQWALRDTHTHNMCG